MKTLLTLLLAAFCAATGYGQTIKTLGYNTTNGQVVYSGTNTLTLMGSNGIVIDAGGGQTITVNVSGINFQTGPNGSVLNIPSDNPVELGGGVWDDPSVRSSLGFSTNLNTFWKSTNSSDARSAVNLGATWLTNTNVTNFRTAIGLGINDTVTLAYGTDAYIGQDGGGLYVENFYPDYIQCGQFGIGFGTTNSAATTRTNLGLGGGITATNTFVSYNGTNYTTNSVSISNGVITGWTQ
jgi:hypothetical protein